jgi:D-alanyl-D-alanine carboxypeptidase (penicillin-binding protein 5/6)
MASSASLTLFSLFYFSKDRVLLRHLFTRLLFVACMATAALPALAQMPEPPEVAAKAYLLMDVTTGQVLAARDPDQPVEPASLTKLMTAYLVFDALKAGKISLAQTFPVSERAWKMPGSRMFIDPKMQVPVEDLIKGMIVQSGNDATMALAEGVGGSLDRFVQMMNDQSRALGMKNSSFKNPEGLTEAGHVTTARDLATLATALMRNFPEYVPFYAIQRYRYPGTPAANDANRNLLLFRDPSVDGLKTGHTNAAGYCLVATARRQVSGLGEGALGQRRLLSVLLGATSENARAAESQKLLNWGYTAFDTVRLFPAGQAVATPQVWKGKSSVVRLGRPEGVVVSVPAGEGARLKTDIARPEPLVAPLTRGQSVGTLRVSLTSGATVAELPLSVLETVEESGIFGRAWDALRLWIK